MLVGRYSDDRRGFGPFLLRRKDGSTGHEEPPTGMAQHIKLPRAEGMSSELGSPNAAEPPEHIMYLDEPSEAGIHVVFSSGGYSMGWIRGWWSGIEVPANWIRGSARSAGPDPAVDCVCLGCVEVAIGGHGSLENDPRPDSAGGFLGSRDSATILRVVDIEPKGARRARPGRGSVAGSAMFDEDGSDSVRPRCVSIGDHRRGVDGNPEVTTRYRDGCDDPDEQASESPGCRTASHAYKVLGLASGDTACRASPRASASPGPSSNPSPSAVPGPVCEFECESGYEMPVPSPSSRAGAKM